MYLYSTEKENEDEYKFSTPAEIKNDSNQSYNSLSLNNENIINTNKNIKKSNISGSASLSISSSFNKSNDANIDEIDKKRIIRIEYLNVKISKCTDHGDYSLKKICIITCVTIQMETLETKLMMNLNL